MMNTHQTTTNLLRTILHTASLTQAVGTINEDITLAGHLRTLLDASGLSISDLTRRILVSKAFTYQIFDGTRRPGRDVLLRIAFALGLSLEGTQRLLAVAQRGTLYPRVRRDAAVIFALQHKYTLVEADEALRSIGERPLLDTSAAGRE